MDHLKTLRVFAIMEGFSTIALFGFSMPMKYIFDDTTTMRPVGMAHGVLFIGYCIWVVLAAMQNKWKASKTLWALFASLIPFGTFVADYKLFRNN
ncbi:MAG: DUF3817 domain-containing protein [Bacteroidetes bacterium]|nr:DUF3817 domain-containing protein [Bacteroidota bacterium]